MADIRLIDTRREGDHAHATTGDDLRERARQSECESVHLHLALDVLRRRWRADVVWCLRGGALRFNALLVALSPVSHKVLTEQLRALERAGVVTRSLGPHGGRRVEYRLTSLGAELPPILERLRAWGVAQERVVRERSGRAVRPRGVTGPSHVSAG